MYNYQQQPMMQQPMMMPQYNPNMFTQMGYGQVQRPKGTNALTMEQVQELQQKAGGLNLMPTKEEYYQAICTHRDVKNGQNVLVANETGDELTCPICASQFAPLNMTEQDVKEAVKMVCDILENTKMLYLDIPPEVCAEFMKILPMIKKIPALYKIAAANFRQYENAVNIAQTGSSSFINQYNFVNGPTGPNYGIPNPMMMQQSMMMPQQPMMQQQAYMAPQEMVQPMGFTQQQMDMTGGFNPFYGNPQAQPQFTNMQGQQQPQQNCNCGNHQQAPQQQQGEVAVEKQFNV